LYLLSGLKMQGVKLGSIILFVKDLERTIDYYRTVLEIPAEKGQPLPAKRAFRFRTGDCVLTLRRSSKPNGGRQLLVFQVDQIHEVYQELQEKGLRVRPMESEGGFSWFDLSDPEGNRVRFRGAI